MFVCVCVYIGCNSFSQSGSFSFHSYYHEVLTLIEALLPLKILKSQQQQHERFSDIDPALAEHARCAADAAGKLLELMGSCDWNSQHPLNHSSSSSSSSSSYMALILYHFEYLAALWESTAVGLGDSYDEEFR